MSNIYHNVQYFEEKIKCVKNTFNNLISTPPTTPAQILNITKQIGGVYVFSEITNNINLINIPLTTPAQILNITKQISGVYVFSEIINNTERFMYVGQSESLINRLAEHCAIKNHQRANFAYMMAVKLTGLKPIPGSPDSTKESMFRIDTFVDEFNKTIERIKLMNYRWIQVNDKLEKNLLEIYAAVVLDAEFNEFS